MVVAARDEAGTIARLVRELPALGKWTEIVFVEGFSRDDTWEVIQAARAQESPFPIVARKQNRAKGKAYAVHAGIRAARGDIILILDADLSVRPAELRKFYRALASGRAQFANGSRFVYPKEKGAMRFFNHLGNRFFALVFSLLLRQRITDTLCGTKGFFRTDYKRFMRTNKALAAHDPYGDFTLLLGAAQRRLRVVEIAVKYKARVYGKSKISPFWDGLRLLFLVGLYVFSFVRLQYHQRQRS